MGHDTSRGLWYPTWETSWKVERIQPLPLYKIYTHTIPQYDVSKAPHYFREIMVCKISLYLSTNLSLYLLWVGSLCDHDSSKKVLQIQYLTASLPLPILLFLWFVSSIANLLGPTWWMETDRDFSLLLTCNLQHDYLCFS